jgi:hypothetical protein
LKNSLRNDISNQLKNELREQATNKVLNNKVLNNKIKSEPENDAFKHLIAFKLNKKQSDITNINK